MEAEVFKLALSQGPFAALFVVLLFWVLKENSKREDRLLACLETLAKQYESISHDVNTLKEDVNELKERLI